MAEPLILQARPLAAHVFHAFGDVVEMAGHAGVAMNRGGRNGFMTLPPSMYPIMEGASASVLRAHLEAAPVALRLVERHPLGSQLFMPLEPHLFLVVVAPAGELPAAEALQAFVSNGRQGVNYQKGVWHHPMIALEAMSDFLSVDLRRPGSDCEEAEIAGGDIVVRL